ncbi:hypothetical protein MJN54_36265, partial [Salmonella enterica subsp. enterica serovar Kentucky]|nr:hypothetical protein [Salmonella enterica subsp. enterica serovar Kentucky]
MISGVLYALLAGLMWGLIFVGPLIVPDYPALLQYMCHMNYAYVPNATFRQNIPDTALKLRESVPAHVKPTAQWL